MAIYGSCAFTFSLRATKSRSRVPMLSGTSTLNVSAYIQKIPNVTSDDIPELDAHLAQVPMRLTAMGVDPEAKQGS